MRFWIEDSLGTKATEYGLNAAQLSDLVEDDEFLEPGNYAKDLNSDGVYTHDEISNSNIFGGGVIHYSNEVLIPLEFIMNFEIIPTGNFIEDTYELKGMNNEYSKPTSNTLSFSIVTPCISVDAPPECMIGNLLIIQGITTFPYGSFRGILKKDGLDIDGIPIFADENGNFEVTLVTSRLAEGVYTFEVSGYDHVGSDTFYLYHGSDSIWHGIPLLEYKYPDILALEYYSAATKEVYVKLPKTAQVLTSRMTLTGQSGVSSFPTNPWIDIGGDGSQEWSQFGQLMDAVIIDDMNTNPTFTISLQNYLDSPENQPDSDGYILVPIEVYSESEGDIVISNVDIRYIYKWTQGRFSKLHDHPHCFYKEFTVDIYYTGRGGIEIDDSNCDYIDYINNIEHPNWQIPATMKQYYYDEDDDGIVDGTSWAESTLKMYWYDESTQNWVPTADVFGADNTGVNIVDNFVWTNVDHFSGFASKGSYVPLPETEDLIETVEGMLIQHGIKNSLLVKLDGALNYLTLSQYYFVNGFINLGTDHLSLAERKINDFINEVEAKRGKGISEEDAYLLLNKSQVIIVMINEAYV
jgi:hypothetical protein